MKTKPIFKRATGLGRTVGDNLDWKFQYEKKLKEQQALEQNINMVHKLNEANHDYNTLRRRAKIRRAYRAKKQEVENERNIGMAELNRAYRRSMRERITESCVWIFVGVLLTLWLH